MLWLNLLTANPTKWSNRLKQFVGNNRQNSLSAFDHFGELALKALIRLRKHGSSTNIVTFT